MEAIENQPDELAKPVAFTPERIRLEKQKTFDLDLGREGLARRNIGLFHGCHILKHIAKKECSVAWIQAALTTIL